MTSSSPQHQPLLFPAAARAASRDEQGFTLVEVIMVVLIIGILTAVAVPSYVSLQARADQGAAKAAVRGAVPAVEAYYVDQGTFNGITISTLKSTYDKTLDTTTLYIVSTSAGTGTDNSFLLCAKSHTWYAYKDGPAAEILASASQPTSSTGAKCTL